MTCIVGMLDKKTNNVVIGGDSSGVSDDSITIRKDPKVFKNGEFIFGCSTSFRMIQLLRFSFKPPKMIDNDVYKYFCTDFVDALRECFKIGGFLQKDSDGSEMGGNFLVGYKNYLFKIEKDFQVEESIDGFNAVGCGMDFALGAMQTLKDIDIPADEKIIKSLKCAEYFSTGVRGPFILLNS